LKIKGPKIDVAEKGVFKGGLICIGFKKLRECYRSISPKLDIEFFDEIDVESISSNSTQESVSRGAFFPLVVAIRKISKNRKLFFTGGDGEMLCRIVKKGEYKSGLVFEGMLKAVKEKLC
jgi:type III pantothenate kinase